MEKSLLSSQQQSEDQVSSIFLQGVTQDELDTLIRLAYEGEVGYHHDGCERWVGLSFSVSDKKSESTTIFIHISGNSIVHLLQSLGVPEAALTTDSLAANDDAHQLLCGAQQSPGEVAEGGVPHPRPPHKNAACALPHPNAPSLSRPPTPTPPSPNLSWSSTSSASTSSCWEREEDESSSPFLFQREKLATGNEVKVRFPTIFLEKVSTYVQTRT